MLMISNLQLKYSNWRTELTNKTELLAVVCLQETHLAGKKREKKLKVKEWKKIFQVSGD
jgi:hypothetical protein